MDDPKLIDAFKDAVWADEELRDFLIVLTADPHQLRSGVAGLDVAVISFACVALFRLVYPLIDATRRTMEIEKLFRLLERYKDDIDPEMQKIVLEKIYGLEEHLQAEDSLMQRIVDAFTRVASRVGIGGGGVEPGKTDGE